MTKQEVIGQYETSYHIFCKLAASTIREKKCIPFEEQKNPIILSANFINKDILSSSVVSGLPSLRKMELGFTEMYKKTD